MMSDGKRKWFLIYCVLRGSVTAGYVWHFWCNSSCVAFLHFQVSPQGGDMYKEIGKFDAFRLIVNTPGFTN